MPYAGREENERRLVQAVGTVLAREGFKKLGVNRVAKEAGVDKVLIYRYFGGLRELVAAFSRTLEFWPTLDELMAGEEDGLKVMGAEEQLAFLFKSFLRALRRRPLTQMIMVWWASEADSALAKELEPVRMRTALEFFERLENIPVEPDLTAVVVLLYSAVTRVIETAQVTGFIGGIDLTTELGWLRIEEGIDLLARGVFSAQS